MKNLFKNLMLVAVAAMAFTACTETNDEVNAVVNKTRYEFTANIAEETRSGFAEKEEGATAYKSEWFGDETLKIFLNTNDGWSAETTALINAEGQFSFEVENAPESFFMTVVSPAESWSSQYSYTVPTEQTPLANSVDPKAHLLQSSSTFIQTGSESISMSPQYACYGKMTVDAPGFTISKVEVSFNGGKVYTLNAKNVENNVFWFAVDSMIDVSTFTVTAYNAEGNAVAKTVDVAAAGKELKFQWGRVSTFSVSGLAEVVAPSAPMFTSAGYNGNPGDKVVKLYSDTLGELWMNFYGSNPLLSSDNWINPGQYGKDNGMYFGGNYGQYKPAGFSEFLTAAPNWFTLDVSIVDGKYKFVINADYTNMYDGVVLENATFIGEIPGLGMPDMRTLLAAPSNVTGSADGKTITLSWDPVQGADGYRVSLFSPYDEYFEETVTTNEYVYEAQLYSKEYSFTIMPYALDTNAQYRYSEDVYEYAYVTTGKDPSIWADVVANNIIWDSSNGAFKMTGEVVSGTAWGHANDYVRLYINQSDRPGNNSIKVGTYTGCGGTSPQAGQFGARLSLYWGSVTMPSAFGTTSTVEVSYDEAVGYTIVLTHNNVTYGYKGMPEGWVAPSEGGESGGDEPVNPDPEQPGQTYSTVFTSCKCVNNMDMGEGWGAKFELSNDEGLFLWLWVAQASVNQSTGAIATGDYNFHNEWCDYPAQPGFVVKKMRLPGHGDEEFGIINASFKSNLNGTTNDLTFEITLEDNSITTYTFNGTVVRAW